MAGGKCGTHLSDEDKRRIREYIEVNHLQEMGREKLAVMILADLKIAISGKSAAKIREEALNDLTLANTQKEESIRSQVLDELEGQAPKILQYLWDEVRDLRARAGLGIPNGAEGADKPSSCPEVSIIDRVRLSTAIQGCCKTLIEVIGTPKPDRRITTTLEVVETADVSEYMKYGDKSSDTDTTKMENSEGDSEAEADACPGSLISECDED